MALDTSGHGPRQSVTSDAAAPRPDALGNAAYQKLARARSVLSGTADWLGTALAPAQQALRWVANRAGRSRIGRFLSSSLLRRIVISNLLGLGILFAGAMYLSQFNIWLIDSKRENLQVRALTMANALATGATVSTQDGTGSENSSPSDANPFADLELSLDPVIVAQELRQLLSDNSNRARVYDLRGNLVYDSEQSVRPDKRPPAEGKKERPRTKNWLTRTTQKLLRSDLRVYNDPDHANGFAIREVRRAIAGQTSAFLLLTGTGRQIVSIATPIRRANAPTATGVLLLSTHVREIDRAADEQRMVILGFAFVSLAAAMFASYMLARTVAGPMQELSEAAEHVTRDIHAAADLPRFDDREDEVGRLSRAFEAMTASLYRRIEASEKFAADVAHELKNPLAAANSLAQAFDYAKTDEQREELIKQIRAEIERLNGLITDVSNASRLDAELMRQQREPVDVVEVAENVASTFTDLLSNDGKSVQLHFDAAARASSAYAVSGQPGRIGQVLTNLVDNALSFSPHDGIVDMRIRRESGDIVISVEDQGPGIDSDQLDSVFRRFYTYRPTAESSRGSNSGLGLSISREIINAHDGEIWAENRPPRDGAATGASGGARFVIRLPSADRSKLAVRSRRSFARLLGGRTRKIANQTGNGTTLK